jgi:hypothetical protein
MSTGTATADKASLQVIGFVLASITASIIFVAAMLVHASAQSQLTDHQPSWQVARTSGL